MNAIKTRWAVFKNGYVKEDGSIIDPIDLGQYWPDMKTAEDLMPKNKSDYHILQQEKDPIHGWSTVEGSEIHF